VPEQHVAFLRAINVGGRIVKMARLKEIFESSGLRDVETFIASGNVMFRSGVTDASKLERQIERALAAALGYTVTTFVRTTRALASTAAFEPFPELAGQAGTLYVGFLKDAPAQATRQAIAGLRSETDDFRIEDRELYWLCRTGVLESKVSGNALEKALKGPATLRNINTVRRLAAKYPPPAGMR